MLIHAEKKKHFQGLKFNKELFINHLLFTDDSLIFSRAAVDDCKKLKQIFDCYAAAFGQIFNFEKSSMLFSGNVSAGQINEIKDIFQLKVVSKHEKYLGLPFMVGRKKVRFFKEIKWRILSKISGWQSKFFSCGGREVQIKAVAQAVPAYAMNVFRLPTTLCEDMQRAVPGFWWGAKKDWKSIHWTKWESLCHAKGRGGLGFRDFACFNQALIAKQSWRIIQNPESLMMKILQARYFKSTNFLQAKLGSKPSFIWRSILWGDKSSKKE